MRGTWREGSFTRDPKLYGKEIYQERCINALEVGISLRTGHVGEIVEGWGNSLAGPL
jgi:hypothetical protein